MLGPIGLVNALLTLFIWLRTLLEAHRALLPPGNARIEPHHLGRTHIEHATAGAADAEGEVTQTRGTPSSKRGAGPGALRQRRGSPERRAALRGALTIMFISVLWVKIEPLLDNTLGWIVPFFSFVKLLALFAFLLIRQQLAQALLRSFIEPALRPYEPTIDTLLRNAGTATEVSRFLISLPLAHLTRWLRHRYQAWIQPWFGPKEAPMVEPDPPFRFKGQGLEGERIVPPPPLRKSRSRVFAATGGPDGPSSTTSLAPPARSLRHRGSHASLSSSVSDANLANAYAGPSRLPMAAPRKPSGAAAATAGRSGSGSRVVSAPSRAPSGSTSTAPSTAQLLASLPDAPSSAPRRPDGRVPSPPRIPPPTAPGSSFTPSRPGSSSVQGTPISALKNFAYIPPGTPPGALPYSLLPGGPPVTGSPSLTLPPALHGSRAYEASPSPITNGDPAQPTVPPTVGPTPVPPGGFFAPNSIAQNLATRMARVGGPTTISDGAPLELGRRPQDEGMPGMGTSPAVGKASGGVKRKASEGQLGGTPTPLVKADVTRARGQAVRAGGSMSASSSAAVSPAGSRKKSRTTTSASGATELAAPAPRMTRSKSSRAVTPLVTTEPSSEAEEVDMDEEGDGGEDEARRQAPNGTLRGTGKRKAEVSVEPARTRGKEGKGVATATKRSKPAAGATVAAPKSKAKVAPARKTRANSARLEEEPRGRGDEGQGARTASSAPSSNEALASTRGVRGRTNLHERTAGSNGRGGARKVR